MDTMWDPPNFTKIEPNLRAKLQGYEGCEINKN